MHFNRQGTAIVWMAVVGAIMVGLASLAVDYGRAQLAKSQLQSGATAAARAAVASLSAGVTAAQTAARDTAAVNYVDGTPLALDLTNDVEFGTWNDTARSFTTLTGAARSG